jgi:pseudouridine synthase
VDVLQTQADATLLRIVMHEGRKRQIRRVASMLGHRAQELKRVRLGPLQLGTLEVGQWRYLTPKEIRKLQSLKGQAGKRGQRTFKRR